MSFVLQTQDHYERCFRVEQNILCVQVQFKTHRNSEYWGFFPEKLHFKQL